MKILYGTANQAKLSFMARSLEQCRDGMQEKLELIGLEQIVQETKILPPEIEEVGHTPLHNARIKAKAYYDIYGIPVFSCDTGLFLKKEETGELLPEEEQPGLHVRVMNGRRLTDEELQQRIIRLVRKYGLLEAQYRNAVCFILDHNHVYESDAEELSGKSFLFTDQPHSIMVPGFPLDSLSIQKRTGKYYYDLAEHEADELVTDQEKNGFIHFFRQAGILSAN